MDQKDKEGLQMTGSSICLTNHIQMIIERKLEIVNNDSNRPEIKGSSKKIYLLPAVIGLDFAPLFGLPF